MSYLRVIPRDLFNEAKLLKCLGQLALLIHNGVRIPKGLKLQHDDSEFSGFQIEQSHLDGALYCPNLELSCGGRHIGLVSPYNNKNPFPLQFMLGDDEAGEVFTDSGELSDEFRALCDLLQ